MSFDEIVYLLKPVSLIRSRPGANIIDTELFILRGRCSGSGRKCKVHSVFMLIRKRSLIFRPGWQHFIVYHPNSLGAISVHVIREGELTANSSLPHLRVFMLAAYNLIPRLNLLFLLDVATRKRLERHFLDPPNSNK